MSRRVAATQLPPACSVFWSLFLWHHSACPRLTAGENHTANQQLPPKTWINQSLSWFPALFMTHTGECSYRRSDGTSYQNKQFSLSAARISTDYCYDRIVLKGWTASKNATLEKPCWFRCFAGRTNLNRQNHIVDPYLEQIDHLGSFLPSVAILDSFLD